MWDVFKKRLNERSTWTTITAAVLSSLPSVLGAGFPYNALLFIAAILGVFVADGKVVQPVDPAL